MNLPRANVQGERDRVLLAAAAIGSPHQTLLHLVALGLTTQRKWDRAENSNPSPTPAQLAIADAFTPSEFQAFTDGASGLIRDYVAGIPDARKSSFWLPVWQGMLSAFFYSLFLIAAALLGGRLAGHELIELLRDALTQRPGG